jgi:hypothetical protein
VTEAEWLASADPTPMWECLRGSLRDRKCRLLAAATIHRVAAWFSSDAATHELLLGAVEVGEQYADGALPPVEFKALRDQFDFYARLGPLSDAQRFAGEAVALLFADAPDEAAYGITFAADAVTELTEGLPTDASPLCEHELATQAGLVRDIFGNPHRPVTVDAAWRTPAVVTLAQAVYDGRAFDRLPELADALEGAGCTDTAVLSHCRSDGPHVRGCWAVDLILGRSDAMTEGWEADGPRASPAFPLST